MGPSNTTFQIQAANGPTTANDFGPPVEGKGSALFWFLSSTVDFAAASRASKRCSGPFNSEWSKVEFANGF
eukprot:COSAG02_NODE_10413_length_1946_cov_1.282079_1_plen_71_part_00